MGKARTPQQKEEAQKRRKMQREIYERLDEEARKEFVETRQKGSQKKTQKRKDKIAFFNDCVRRGMEYARKNSGDLLFFEGYLQSPKGEPTAHRISACAIRKTAENGKDTYYQIGYAFQMPTDGYSSRIALGLPAYRIMDGIRHPYQFKLSGKRGGTVLPKQMRASIAGHIQLDAVSRRVDVPSKICNLIIGQTGHSIFLHDMPKKKESKKVRGFKEEEVPK